MAVMVPYYGGRLARAQVAKAFSTTGTRQQGRVPVVPNMYARPHIQPIVPATGVLSGFGETCCNECAGPDIPYHIAKRMSLGALGAAYTSPVGAGAGAGAASGAATGASIGSAVPVIGTAVGAIVGAIGGAIAGSLNKKDPEQYNFDQAVALWQQNRLSVLNIGNKYLVLAGLFDLSLKNPHIPIYQKYGRMGEQRFTTDLANKVYQAAMNGQITAKDTPLTIKNNIVQPWIDSWGYGPMVDPHADMIDLIITGMVADYVANQQNNWVSRTGVYPFGSSIQPFPIQKILAAAAAPPVTAPPVQVPAPVISLPTPVAAPIPIAAPTPAPVQAPFVSQVALMPSQTAAPVITQPACTAPLVWNGTQCVMPSQPAVSTPAAVTATPVAAVAAAPPAGFSQIGTDTSGNPVFASPQGMLYEWNGTAMQLFTGSLASGQTIASQVQSAIQQALSQGQTPQQAAQYAIAQAQSQGAPISPADQSTLAQQAAATAAAPTVATSTVTGGGEWLLLGGGVLLVVLLARGRRHG